MSALAQLQALQWREPMWLLLALVPLLLALSGAFVRRRKQRRFADAALLPWVLRGPSRGPWGRLLSPRSAWVLAWVLLAIAAAGPRLAERLPMGNLYDGVDITVVLDVSRSMTAGDVQPTRLRRARIELQELLQRLRGDRVGVVLYAGSAHVLVPLTHDPDAVSHYLGALKPGLLPARGSALAAGLRKAGQQLSQSNAGARAVLVVSDGGGANEDSMGVAGELRRQGISVYVLGVGTVEGAPIPLDDGRWLTAAGEPVVTRLHRDGLSTLARTGAGAYMQVTDDDYDWRRLYDDGIATLASHALRADKEKLIVWRELYPWVVVPAIALLLLAFYPVGLRSGVSSAVVLLIVGSAAVAPPAGAAELNRGQWAEAHQAYREGDFAGALQGYARVPGYVGRFGEGASAYRRSDYERAVQQFRRAVLQADTDRRRARALFNLGNSYFQLGDYASAADIYADVLRYRAGHQAARRNRELAAKLERTVDARLQGRAPRRGGGGPGEARSRSPDADLEGGTARIADTEDQQKRTQTAMPDAGDLDSRQLAELIARGLRHAAVADAGRARATDSAAMEPGALDVARSDMERLSEDPSGLWKRLFEMEQGLPAPLQEPRTLPEVEPW